MDSKRLILSRIVCCIAAAVMILMAAPCFAAADTAVEDSALLPDQALAFSTCNFLYTQRGLKVSWSVTAGNADASSYEYEIADVRGKTLLTGNVPTCSLYMKKYPYWRSVTKIRVRPVFASGGKVMRGSWTTYRALVPQPVLSTGKAYGRKKDGTIRLGWKRVKDAARYLVFVSEKEACGYRRVATVKQKSSAIIAVTLKKFKGKKFRRDKKYYIRIVTVAKGGLGRSGRDIFYKIRKKIK